MSDEPREFWIAENGEEPCLCFTTDEYAWDSGFDSDEIIHVIEKSAYDDLLKEDQKLKAENERLSKWLDLILEERGLR